MRNVIDEMKSFQQFDFFNLDMYFCSVLLRSCLCSLVFRPYIVFYCQKVKNICPPLKDDVVWQIIVPHRSGINIFPSSLVWPWNIWCKISIKFAVIVVVCVCSWKIKAESNLYCEIERESGSHLVHDWCCWSKYAFFTFSRPFKVVGSRINHCSTKLDVYSSR